MTKFAVGQKVTDRDGRTWVVLNITHYSNLDGDYGYSVRRYEDGRCLETVRYEPDLTPYEARP